MNNTRRASHGLAEFVQREYLSADVADSGTKSYSGEVGSSLGTISSDRLEASEHHASSQAHTYALCRRPCEDGHNFVYQIFTLVGTVIILPIILSYTALSYWVFRGKVRHGDEGYH
jgi:hypothetical protein